MMPAPTLQAQLRMARRESVPGHRSGISAIALQFGLTARAIRFYEEKGLIAAGRDRLNHRYYDAEARRRLQWITLFRRAGLSLPEISKLISPADRPGAMERPMRDALERREAQLEAELLELKDVMALFGPTETSARAQA